MKSTWPFRARARLRVRNNFSSCRHFLSWWTRTLSLGPLLTPPPLQTVNKNLDETLRLNVVSWYKIPHCWMRFKFGAILPRISRMNFRQREHTLPFCARAWSIAFKAHRLLYSKLESNKEEEEEEGRDRVSGPPLSHQPPRPPAVCTQKDHTSNCSRIM